MKVDVLCNWCGKNFSKEKNEFNRQTRKNNPMFCSKDCCNKNVSKKAKKWIIVNRTCKFCKTEFESTNQVKHKVCCSKQCAGKYSQSFQDKEKLSTRMKNLFQEGKIKAPISRDKNKITSSKRRNDSEKLLYDLICYNCGKEFQHKQKKIKHCSPECVRINRSNKCGGQTNYKRYNYKGISMDSSWEVMVAEWLDEQKINWIRDRTLKFKWNDENNIIHHYYPDFFLPDLDLYIDPKNKYLMEKDLYKINKVKDTYKIDLICGEIESIKQYILEKLNNKQ